MIFSGEMVIRSIFRTGTKSENVHFTDIYTYDILYTKKSFGYRGHATTIVFLNELIFHSNATIIALWKDVKYNVERDVY